MTAPVSMNSSTNPQTAPIGAFGLGSSKKLEAGNFVVNPPQTFYKYSVYDELELGKDRFKELLSSLNSKSAEKNIRKSKRQRVVSKVINLALVITAGVLAYRYRAPLKNIIVNSWNMIKNCFKKKP